MSVYRFQIISTKNENPVYDSIGAIKLSNTSGSFTNLLSVTNLIQSSLKSALNNNNLTNQQYQQQNPSRSHSPFLSPPPQLASPTSTTISQSSIIPSAHTIIFNDDVLLQDNHNKVEVPASPQGHHPQPIASSSPFIQRGVLLQPKLVSLLTNDDNNNNNNNKNDNNGDNNNINNAIGPNKEHIRDKLNTQGMVDVSAIYNQRQQSYRDFHTTINNQFFPTANLPSDQTNTLDYLGGNNDINEDHDPFIISEAQYIDTNRHATHHNPYQPVSMTQSALPSSSSSLPPPSLSSLSVGSLQSQSSQQSQQSHVPKTFFKARYACHYYLLNKNSQSLSSFSSSSPSDEEFICLLTTSSNFPPLASQEDEHDGENNNSITGISQFLTNNLWFPLRSLFFTTILSTPMSPSQEKSPAVFQIPVNDSITTILNHFIEHYHFKPPTVAIFKDFEPLKPLITPPLNLNRALDNPFRATFSSLWERMTDSGNDEGDDDKNKNKNLDKNAASYDDDQDQQANGGNNAFTTNKVSHYDIINTVVLTTVKDLIRLPQSLGLKQQLLLSSSADLPINILTQSPPSHKIDHLSSSNKLDHLSSSSKLDLLPRGVSFDNLGQYSMNNLVNNNKNTNHKNNINTNNRDNNNYQEDDYKSYPDDDHKDDRFIKRKTDSTTSTQQVPNENQSMKTTQLNLLTPPTPSNHQSTIWGSRRHGVLVSNSSPSSSSSASLSLSNSSRANRNNNNNNNNGLSPFNQQDQLNGHLFKQYQSGQGNDDLKQLERRECPEHNTRVITQRSTSLQLHSPFDYHQSTFLSPFQSDRQQQQPHHHRDFSSQCNQQNNNSSHYQKPSPHEFHLDIPPTRQQHDNYQQQQLQNNQQNDNQDEIIAPREHDRLIVRVQPHGWGNPVTRRKLIYGGVALICIIAAIVLASAFYKCRGVSWDQC